MVIPDPQQLWQGTWHRHWSRKAEKRNITWRWVNSHSDCVGISDAVSRACVAEIFPESRLQPNCRMPLEQVATGCYEPRPQACLRPCYCSFNAQTLRDVRSVLWSDSSVLPARMSLVFNEQLRLASLTGFRSSNSIQLPSKTMEGFHGFTPLFQGPTLWLGRKQAFVFRQAEGSGRQRWARSANSRTIWPAGHSAAACAPIASDKVEPKSGITVGRTTMSAVAEEGRE